MFSQEQLGIENKAIQPDDEGFEFRAGELDSYRTDAIIQDLRNMRDGVVSVIETMRDDIEVLEEHKAVLDSALALAEGTHEKIQQGTFATPQPTPALPQEQIEERHRAPF